MTIRPFTIHIDETVLDDLHERLKRTRWPDQIADAGWDYGTNLAYLQELTTYWRETFDWRAQERLLNTFPQFQTEIDGQGIHFIHVRGKGPHPLPLLISHGWPGSFFEMYKIIGPLSDPASFGGNPEDAFDVVVPSLPGYGFSASPHHPGMNTGRIADLFHRLMTSELGYQHYGAQGGDWGSGITTNLGRNYPEHLIGIHLNMVPLNPRPSDTNQTPEEQHWLERLQTFRTDGSGYQGIQATRPQTLAYGLNDSPTGLAGWIVEKFYAWSDCHGDVESAFTRDELLTNIMLYWVTATINSSTRLYYEATHQQPANAGDEPKITVPTGVAAFPAEIAIPPRSLAEKKYTNIQRWSVMERGGHFAALEQPELLTQEIRAFFRPLRSIPNKSAMSHP